MAFISCRLKSAVLQTQVDVQLYFPCDLPQEVGNSVNGVITLLHGFTNTGDEWVQYSAAARYAADNGLALVIPSCGNCFYNDMKYGGAYFTFLTQEMPALLSSMFKLPQEREKNYIAGLSMGGYGALHLGLACSDRYSACASFSGAVDLKMMLSEKDMPAVKFVFTPVFGEELILPDQSDLFFQARHASQMPVEKRPRVLCTCGRQDYEPYMIRTQNQAFAEHMKTLDLDFKYLEWDGVHEWSFWDKSLVLAIDFFLQNKYADKKLSDWTACVEEVV